MVRYYALDEEDFAHLYKYDEENNKYWYMDHCWTGEGVWCETSDLNFERLIEISPERAYIKENALDPNNQYPVKRKGVTMINKIALLYIIDKKILSTRSKGKDVFYLPGGKIEGNETDIQTLVREIKEELSVDIREDTANFYGAFEAQAHGKSEGVVVRMRCYIALFDGEPKPSSEIEEIAWLTTADMNRISPVDKIIFENLHQLNIID